MTQRQMNRAVARATGESLATIVRRGFSPLRPRRSTRRNRKTKHAMIFASSANTDPAHAQ